MTMVSHSTTTLLGLILLASATSACTGEQSYTPIGDDQFDQLCEQEAVTFTANSTRFPEFTTAGVSEWNGSLEVTSFSKTDMAVSAEELVYTVPANSVANIEVSTTESLDFFTDFVFSIDLRANDTMDWQPYSLSTDSGAKVSWFHSAKIDSKVGINNFSTYARCNTTKRTVKDLLPEFGFTSGYEIRLQVYPFNGLGDLAGSYDYRVDFTLR